MSTRTYRVEAAEDTSLSLALLRRLDDFGLISLDLAQPPSRFWGGRRTSGPVLTAVDEARCAADHSFAELIDPSEPLDIVMPRSRRALGQLLAWFLIAEDPQRRLDARTVATLAHQVSLVRHVLGEASLKSVLIADEVGLGKTIEAGLILKELLETNPRLRVLYLAPAGLVRNVHRELSLLELPVRMWVSGADNSAQLADQMIVASIHRAVHPAHFDKLIASGPWDILVVDECHHLSDWQKDGGRPTQKFKLVDKLRAALSPDSRLVLMSGTPHQGHPNRFENLLNLLRRGNETRDALAGRVIYRTKEDVSDWDGRPLFPRRNVRPPHVIDLGPEHRRWLEAIHQTFDTRRSEAGPPEFGSAKRRALDWRCGQALQWATSSIEAGLGFLVRQAIRAEWTLAEPALHKAIAALRPYRCGPVDEELRSLYQRIAKEIGQQRQDADLDDIDDDDADSERWQPERQRLAIALTEGVRLLASHGSARWDKLRSEVIDKAPGDKIVLFAQPIETVTALATYLERIDGRRPAMIIGGQRPDERAHEVAEFWQPDGPRFLVSSRAGGEGFNLQVAHVIVHVDVPWNPMELEQRVGRVHRFMSKKTIQVHTLVVKDSREVDMYDVARDKLRAITKALGGSSEERFEQLFARVMALVPPEDLAGVLVRDAVGPLSDGDQNQLAAMITDGYQRWKQFDQEFSAKQREIRAAPAGHARWADLEQFAISQLRAKPIVDGLSAQRLIPDGDEIIDASETADGLDIDGELFSCGDHAAMQLSTHDGRKVNQLGLNHERVHTALRRLGLPTPGVAHLRASPGLVALGMPGEACGVLIYGRVNLSIDAAAYRETGVELKMYIVSPGATREVESAQRGSLVRALISSTVRREPDVPAGLIDAIRVADERLATELRQPTDRSQRHALFPVAVIIAT